ncbi:MAG: glycosyltransferase family 4 protein [Actinomycetes bacterium]|nr:glycosyltransferase family 4 protein [Actinomycetes bacterium]
MDAVISGNKNLTESGLLAGTRVTMLTPMPVESDSRIHKECQALKQAGAEVTVISLGTDPAWTSPYFRSVSVPFPPTRQIPQGAQVSVIASPFRKAGGFLRQKAHETAIRAALDRHPADIYHAHDLPSLLYIQPHVTKTNHPFIYDSHEIWLQLPGTDIRSSDYRRLSVAEAAGIRDAASFITVSPCYAEYFARTYQCEPPSIIANAPTEMAEQATEVHRPVRLLSQSNPRPETNDESLVRAMQYLRGTAVLTIQGGLKGNDYITYLRELVQAEGLGDCVFFSGEYVPEQSVLIAQDHDIGVAVYPVDSSSFDLTLPIRFFVYMAAGLAMAMPPATAFRAFPGFSEFGITLGGVSPQEIAHSLMMLLGDRNQITRMKQRSLEHGRQWTWDRQAARLVELYAQVLRDRQRYE